MKRIIESELDNWLINEARKPLIVRGARQTGKTWLIRNLAKKHKKDIIELNFEYDPQFIRLFKSNDPKKTIDEISLFFNKTIDAKNCILFLDEIQAAGEILAKLRWFAEKMPELPVVSAGSLLEFTLIEHNFSMPVGRIQYLHIEPMGFIEFLMAHKQEFLLEKLVEWRPGKDFSDTLHNQAIAWYQRYAMVGGMPAVVEKDISGASASECRDLQRDLTASYRSDFSKYSKKVDPLILDSTMRYTAKTLGKKFVYSHIDNGIKLHFLKKSLEMLSLARVCHIVRHSSANGLPLGGEIKNSFRKVILTDVGLFHALLDTPAKSAFPRHESLSAEIRGAIAEQLVGQNLRLLGPLNGDGPNLYYWQREGGRPGEIDYLIQQNLKIFPIEIKSGTAGSMKSLHQFMFDKKLDFAIRLDGNKPSTVNLQIKTTQSNPVSFTLLSLPWYAVEFIGGIISESGKD